MYPSSLEDSEVRDSRRGAGRVTRLLCDDAEADGWPDAMAGVRSAAVVVVAGGGRLVGICGLPEETWRWMCELVAGGRRRLKARVPQWRSLVDVGSRQFQEPWWG
jgi:hypothetical protein